MTISQAITTLREMVNERQARFPEDSVLAGVYMQSGAESLNRRAKFYVKDDTTTLALVAGTQEVSLPSDFVEAVWVQHNSVFLNKGSIEEWMREERAWRAEPTGFPAEYALYGLKIVFRKIPNAAAVSAASAAAIRYVACPPEIMANWPLNLGTQSQRVLLYFAAMEYSIAHPTDANAPLRAKAFREMAEAEAALIAQEYVARGTVP